MPCSLFVMIPRFIEMCIRDRFLTFRKYQILPDTGRISAAQAKAKAESEYDIFNKTQRIDSDFDKQIKGMLDK